MENPRSKIKNLQMTWIDAIIIVALLGAAFVGFKIGVISTAGASGAFIVAIVVGSRASVTFAERLGKILQDPDMGYIISFIAAFSLTFIVLIFISSTICKAIRSTPLEWVDSWIGSILGFLAGIVIIGVAIVYLTKYPSGNSEQWLKKSFIVPIIRSIISPLFREFLRKVDMVAPIAVSMLWWF